MYLIEKKYTIKNLIDTLLTPDIQRIVDESRVNEMVDSQVSDLLKHNQITMLQTIVIGKAMWELNHNYYIIDGQHRILAFKTLIELYPHIQSQEIHVLEYNLESNQDLDALFLRVSKTLPVHPLEQAPEWKIIKPYLQYLKTTYSAYMSKSDKPHMPNISYSKLEDRLYNFKYGLKLLSVSWATPDNLRTVTDIFNEYIRQQLASSKFMEKTYNIIISKNKGNGTAWFGVYRNFEWLDIIVNALLENQTLSKTALYAYFYNIKLPDDTNRIQITPTLKKHVWCKVNSMSLIGKCWCCSEQLEYNNMECGHIKAHILGGKSELGNLVPLCKVCNRNMGIIDATQYKNIIETQLETS